MAAILDGGRGHGTKSAFEFHNYKSVLFYRI
jgi:hypothetical protein